MYKGQRVKLKGTDMQGTVIKVYTDDFCIVKWDISGAETGHYNHELEPTTSKPVDWRRN